MKRKVLPGTRIVAAASAAASADFTHRQERERESPVLTDMLVRPLLRCGVDTLATR